MKDRGFVDRVESNTARYISLLHKVLDANKPNPSVNISEEDMTSWDIIGEQRRYNVQMQLQIR